MFHHLLLSSFSVPSVSRTLVISWVPVRKRERERVSTVNRTHGQAAGRCLYSQREREREREKERMLPRMRREEREREREREREMIQRRVGANFDFALRIHTAGG